MFQDLHLYYRQKDEGGLELDKSKLSREVESWKLPHDISAYEVLLITENNGYI